MTVQTPIGQVQTHGGIVSVEVGATGTKAESVPVSEGKAYRAAYAPERMAAVTSSSGELIQVDEGTAEILGVGEKPVMLQAGQSVALQAGKAGMVSEGVKPEIMRPGVVAAKGHSQTPKEGREYLVALRVDQATKLGKALTGAAETMGSGESEKKSDTKNVINGATGGVTLASNNLVSALFGMGNSANPAASTPQDRTGNGFGGVNSNDSVGGVNHNDGSVIDIKTSVYVNDPNALLVSTRKGPIETGVVDEGIYTPLESLSNNFVVAKELMLIGGTPNEAHGGGHRPRD